MEQDWANRRPAMSESLAQTIVDRFRISGGTGVAKRLWRTDAA